MRAFVCASLVTMPDWEPVKLTAGTPRALRAMERRAIEMRSPAESSMSSSRAGRALADLLGQGEEVVRRVAHRGDHHHDVFARGFGAGDAVRHFLHLLHVATDEPPYFWTTMGKGSSA
jgi:hypothetical protein